MELPRGVEGPRDAVERPRDAVERPGGAVEGPGQPDGENAMVEAV